MTASDNPADRLKAGFPAGSVVAHKTGSGPTILGVSTAYNDIAIATLPDGRKIMVVAFLSGSTAPEAERAKALADVARIATENLR
jgi:beta-lactamase class A